MNLSPHLKGAAIAILALALSAGVAFAGSSHGLATASSHAGKTVPTQLTQAGQDTDANENETENDPETEANQDPPETPDASADNCTTDPTNLSPEDLAKLTHGQIVCWAAHQDTPAGYANHGAFVSHWAHAGKSGAGASADKAAKGLSHKAQGKTKPKGS